LKVTNPEQLRFDPARKASVVRQNDGLFLSGATEGSCRTIGPPLRFFLDTTIGGTKMSDKILVAYASRTGSTAGVAEAIGKILAEDGVEVDVRPVSDVTDLNAYRAVVAGSAIQGSQWLPEAMGFLQAHREPLAQKPFAAFLVCMTLTISNGKYREEVASWMQPVRALVRPVSEGLFAGALDMSKVPSFRDRLGFRISVLLRIWSQGDHRDWDAIRAWAEGLRPLLLQ
jgi:menaquinone-dependent protoporphyrinogen oxidase